jgi:hypothetical protein
MQAVQGSGGLLQLSTPALVDPTNNAAAKNASRDSRMVLRR